MFGQIFTVPDGKATVSRNEADLCIFVMLYPSSPCMDKIRATLTDAASLIKYVTDAPVTQIATCNYLY